jgi:cyanophycinase-like exopeptidase
MPSHTRDSARGAVAILGGEGIDSGLWSAILDALLPDGLARVAIMPSALAGQKVGAPERRAGLLADAIAPHGGEVDIIPILSAEDVEDGTLVARLEKADLIVLTGGEVRPLAEVLSGSHAWGAIIRAVGAGAALAAAGGGAVGLCADAYAPVEPVPGELSDLAFEPVAGLGLLSGLVILPCFNWLQDDVASRIEGLMPPGATLLGVDAGAAMTLGPAEWRVVGEGTVTIWRKGDPRQIIRPGEAVPDHLIPPDAVRM